MAITMGLLFAVLFLALAFMIIFSLRRPGSRDQLKKTELFTRHEVDEKLGGSTGGGPTASASMTREKEQKALDEREGKEKDRVA